MKEHWTKLRWLIGGGFLALLVLLVSVIRSWPTPFTRIVFCDVGQGDATLIIHGFTQVLIDGGPTNEEVLRCLHQFLPWWERTLELVVVTHCDADHIGGLPSVFARYQVQATLIDLVGKSSQDFLNLRQALITEAKWGAQVWQPFLGQITQLAEGVTITTLSPQVANGNGDLLKTDLTETVLSDILQYQEKTISNYNDGSIVLLLTIGKVTVLLTGDLEQHGEQALLTRGVITDVDLLKVGHHGSKTSTTPGFLARARPEVTVISSGQNNRYGHPAESVTQSLEEAGAKILRTDQLGDIELISNGAEYWFPKYKTTSLKSATHK